MSVYLDRAARAALKEAIGTAEDERVCSDGRGAWNCCGPSRSPRSGEDQCRPCRVSFILYRLLRRAKEDAEIVRLRAALRGLLRAPSLNVDSLEDGDERAILAAREALGEELRGLLRSFDDDAPAAEDKHVCAFGPFERSRFAGTAHRKCVVPGCKNVSLDGDDEEGGES